MRRSARWRGARGRCACLVVALLLLAACAGPGAGDLRLLVPTEVGGGYDLTARTLAASIAEIDGEPGPPIVVVPGDVGRAALARLTAQRGDADLMMIMGLGLLGGVPESADPDRATPVARLVEEPELVAVGASSPLRSVPDLLAAWRADPGELVLGGVSARGGPDWLVTMRMAAAAGIPDGAVRYRSMPGDALLPAVLRGEVDVAVTGVAETAGQVDGGTVRALAVSSAGRSPRIDAPTLRESGLDVVFANWRGLLAPPGLSDDDRDRLLRLVAEVRASTAWRAAVARTGWTEAPLDGEPFASFLARQRSELTAALSSG